MMEYMKNRGFDTEIAALSIPRKQIIRRGFLGSTLTGDLS
jgi:hypothetical protein